MIDLLLRPRKDIHSSLWLKDTECEHGLLFLNMLREGLGSGWLQIGSPA